MPEEKIPPDDCKLLNFLIIKYGMAEKKGTNLSAVSGFFTGCKCWLKGIRCLRIEDRGRMEGNGR
jgi:hypothetical protein